VGSTGPALRRRGRRRRGPRHALYTIAAQDGIAIAAILAGQFATFSVVGAYLLFGERLDRRQVFGVVMVIVGVAILSAISI
jgi:drug/metabolite transporter (DMT)-like permease